MADIDQLTDEQLAKLPDDDLKLLSQGKGLESLSDQGLALISGGAETSPQNMTETGLRSAANMATGGYLPQIEAAIRSKSLSGPAYEEAKKQSLLALKQGSAQAPAASIAGSIAGAAASPLNVLPIAGAKVLGPVGEVVGGAAQGAAINPGENGSLKDRLYQAVFGAGAGAIGAAGGAMAEKVGGAAEKAAVSGLRPFKRQTSDLMRSGRLNDTGRTILDEGIIGNIPRSGQKLSERIDTALQQTGAQKGELINQLNENPSNTVDLNQIRQNVYEALKLDSSIPGASKYNDQLQEKVDEFAMGKKEMPIKDVDALKTEIGSLVRRWYPANAPKTDIGKEEFYRQLYRAMNKGIDETAETLAKQYNPHAIDELKDLKKTYGGLKSAQEILDQRQIADFANRMASPSDYGMGAAGAIIGATQAGAPGAAVAGAAAGGLNHFLRKYGSQITAKQLDNLSTVLSSPFARGLGIGAMTNESVDINKKLKALEE